MEYMRSFIAIELPEEIRRGLNQLQQSLKSDNQPWVKWTDPQGIHLTLKFLGNITAVNISPLTKSMEMAAQGIPPLHLKVKGLGVFPNLKQVQVVWVGINEEAERLTQLQQRLDSNIVRLGFTPESRRFTPHLTLARLRNHLPLADRQEFGQLIANTRFKTVYVLNVDAFSLMRSQLTRQGTIYSQISQIRLKRNLSISTL
ncbi:RNA 2',3'-cyclic phosphodiesterase [Chloroflexota bacterium]